MKRFELDEEQVDAILELKLYRLARLEILLIQKELGEKRKEAKRLEALLKTRRQALGASSRTSCRSSSSKYGDKRRTKIGGSADEPEFEPDAYIVDEDANVVLTRDGWVKRVRELKDASSTRAREGDAVIDGAGGQHQERRRLLHQLRLGLRLPHRRHPGVDRLRRSGAEAVQVRRRRARGRGAVARSARQAARRRTSSP